MPHLSFVQFPSRAEYSLECCALEEGKGVEPLRQCGRDCICKWEGCGGQGGAKRSNVVEPCGREPEATKGPFSSVSSLKSPAHPLEIIKKSSENFLEILKK